MKNKNIIIGLLAISLAFNLYQFTTNKSSNMMGNMNGMHSMGGGSMMMGHGSMTMDNMVNDLKGKTGKDLEKDFIAGMIPHHQGAVDMAKLLLQDKTVSPQLQKFAQDIITAQESEIGMMNLWLKSY